jgi:ABC-type uncharacterized transport system substrate-binding protein
MNEKILAFAIIGLFLIFVAYAGAQQPNQMRRIGVHMNLAAKDAEGQVYTGAFVDSLQKLGWTVGRNIQIDYRWTEGDPARIRKYAEELVALAPDVILTVGGSQVGPLQQKTRTIPIVFVQVTDPVGRGLVESLAHPGGNTTGFTLFEFDISAKWLEMLKEIAPRMMQVAVLRDPSNSTGTGQFGAIQAVASSFGVEAVPVGLRDETEIERGLTAFAKRPNGGVIVTPTSLAIVQRGFIIGLANRLRLPAIYPFRYFVIDGGLISYGPDVIDQYRRAAGYVDRILKGEKPANLPVQQSTKVDLVINLKTAKQIGLAIPPNVLARADRVIK